MGLETATYIGDLVVSNPLGLDDRKQGDDHIRLIKYVLTHTFPGAGGVGFASPITATEVELNYLSGATSNVQSQLNTITTTFAPLASPALTGNPTAPTPATGDNDTSIATTAFVKAQNYATLDSPALTGNPTAPTQSPGDNDTSVATTAFVTAADVALKADILATVGSPVQFIRRGNVNFTISTTAGRVFTMGYNGSGTLGNGTLNDNVLAEVQFPDDLSGVTITQLETASDTTYVLFSNGDLYGWGDNSTGQLGLGDTTDRRQPTLLLTSVSAIYVPRQLGGYVFDNRACIIAKKNDGTHWFTGYNGYGAAANGTTTNVTTWAAYNPPAGKTFSNIWISGGYAHCVFCKTTDNLIFGVGHNTNGNLGVGDSANKTAWVQVTYFNTITDVTDIQCSGARYDGSSAFTRYSTVVLTQAGNIHTVGSNLNGELGIGSIISTDTFSLVTTGKTATKIVKAASTVYAKFSDNTYAAWGYNAYGQVGNGSTSNQTSPHMFATTIQNIWAVGATVTYPEINGAFILTQTGELRGFGYNAVGRLSIGFSNIDAAVTTPTIAFVNDYTINDMVSSGVNSASTVLMSLTSSNKVFACGSGQYYRHNSTITTDRYTFKPIHVR